ncbi:sensor histidine kinase [Hyunsoonleella aestuarii]|nr:histidine kinase [Hyunsoonleella aestuarii]
MIPLVTIHILFSLLMGVTIMLISCFIFYILDLLPAIPENSTFFLELLVRIVSVSDDNFLVYFAMLGVIYSYSYFKNMGEFKEQESSLKSQLVETKMSLLKSQLDPHFIFNTLNGISALIEIDPDKAQKNISNLSDLLREIIDSKRDNLIPLKKELYIHEKYTSLILTRFSEDLSIEKDVEDNLDEILVPNLIIQSLIENSIKHGFSYKHKTLLIKIVIRKTFNNMLTIIVSNNGKPLVNDFNTLLKKGSGLKNILDRLETIYGIGNFNFGIHNSSTSHEVVTKIVIPI